MTYYKTCPECGSNLDPAEKCNCRFTSADFKASQSRNNLMNNLNHQTVFKGNSGRKTGQAQIKV